MANEQAQQIYTIDVMTTKSQLLLLGLSSS